MKRRNFLSSLAMAGAAGLPPLKGASGAGLSAKLPYRRVRPTDAAWPDIASWAKLNGAVGGN